MRLGGAAWDPYPFILLNLFLSMLAAIQAPVIMMSQNRQDKKDRLRSELDFDVNRRAESEIQGVARKLNLLDEKLDDVEDLMREASGARGSARAAPGGASELKAGLARPASHVFRTLNRFGQGDRLQCIPLHCSRSRLPFAR